ncbi:MAG: DciA family protein [Cyanobacteriota bacterium]|nr:DciA family protein [Cyanobacteriota bacterium]
MPLDSLASLINQFEQQPAWRGQAAFRQVLYGWQTAVGTAVARQAIPVRLDRQVLYVAVANAMWGQTLTLERLTILDKLNHQLSLSLKDIRFSVGDWYRRPTSRVSPAPANPTPLPTWLQHHPSFEVSLLTAAPTAIATDQPRPTTAEAFQRWAQRNQRQVAQWQLCPRCHSPSPPGELDRWQCCSLCAAQGFGQTRGRSGDSGSPG